MTISKAALIDTNVLVYAADKSSPFHEASKDLRDRGLKGEISLCLFPQILCEFFAIVTDRKRVSSPRSQEVALAEIEKYLEAGSIQKLYPGPDILNIICELLKHYPVRKQEIFDLQLVATMLSNDINRIYTHNVDDFRKFKEIDVLEP